jgi:integrase
MPKLADKKLTQRFVNEVVPPRRGRDEYPDGLVRGLRLLVSASDKKCFDLGFRHEGRPRRKKVGDHPQMQLAEARRVAQAARESRDPLTYLGGAVQDDTRLRFAELAEEYIARGMIQRRGANAGEPLKSAARYEAAIRKVLLPAWGSRPVEKLTKADATALTDKVMDRSGDGAARESHRLYMRIFSWAVGRGTVSHHPFQGIVPPAPNRHRDRVLTPVELSDVWAASEEISYPCGPFYRLLILTGQRLKEVAHMEWSEIEGDVWTIPGERTKNGLPSEVPLSSLALAEIEALPRGSGPFVFSYTDGQKPVASFNKLKTKMDRVSGVENWHNHDLRRTLRTGLAELGVPETVAEKVLNHTEPNVLVKTYNRHAYRNEKAAALERWAQRVREIVTPPPDNLTKLRAAQ